jgi:large subunit ribosomal protein L17e
MYVLVISHLKSHFCLAAKCKVADLRVHFKNTYNVAKAVKGRKLNPAITYLEDCAEQKQIIPYTRFTGGVGRHAQLKDYKHTTLGRWPEKSIKAVRELLINLRANAEIKGLDLDRCSINHVVVQRAVNGRRRTYRAHGRISPYLASNCHVEFHCFEKSAGVARTDKTVPRLTKKQAARRLAIGGAK